MTWQEYGWKILQTPAVWVALLAFKNAVLKWFAPDMPSDVNTSFDALVLAGASVFTGAVIQQARMQAQGK